MITLSVDDFKKYCVAQSSTKVVFMNRIFTQGQSFAQHLKDTAISIAQESLHQGLEYLLVDYKTYVTLWREEHASHQPAIPFDATHNKESEAAKNPTDNRQSTVRPSPKLAQFSRGSATVHSVDEQRPAPSPVPVMTYRGRPVQIPTSDHPPAVQQEVPRPSNPKYQLTYRGRTVKQP
ncbi:MAG: hypothetical protein VKL39_17020 [Leptolyngbyaceae bacterium]|nr:hypothetical protein [Leptolyngbyaceae bacterium]